MEGLDIQTLAILGLAAVVMAFLIIAKVQTVYLVYGIMLFASAIAAPVDWQGDPVATWLTPIQSRRSAIFAACGGMMAAACLFHLPLIRAGSIPLQTVALFVSSLYAALIRLVVSGDPVDGIQTVIFVSLTILPTISILPALMNDDEGILRFLRMIALVSVVWIGAVAIQFVVRRSVLTMGGGGLRFQGMLANPQHAAVFLAVCSTVCAYLSANDSKLRWKPLWVVLTAVNVVLVLWTGSRTGLLMTTIGMASIFYARLGQAVLAVPVLGVVFIVAFQIISSVAPDAFNLGEYAKRGDTRSAAWITLFNQFLENPIMGVGAAEDAAYSENSYLAALASYGIGMGLLLLIFTFVSLGMVLRLFRSKQYLSRQQKSLADLYIGYMAMHFAGAMFEGFLHARVGAMLSFFMLFSCIGARLINIASANHLAMEHGTGPGPDEEGYEGEPGYDDYGDPLTDSSARS